MRIRHTSAEDRERVAAVLDGWGMRPVARLGEVYDPLDDPALLAEAADGTVLGVATYRPGDDGWELGTLYAQVRQDGVGTALVEALAHAARRAGARRLWAVTTNDNIDALRFYQRRGFRLVTVHPGAVERSRRDLKPAIPLVGDYGIPIRDEIMVERALV